MSMNLRFCAIVASALIASFSHAGASRLAIVIGEPFTDRGDSCIQRITPGTPVSIPTGAFVIHEGDVQGWVPQYARLTLNPERFPARALENLEKRCFMLLVDGRYTGSGLALSVNTSFLTGIETLNLIPNNETLTLQFTGGNHGMHLSVIWQEQLRKVLGETPW